jgi:hypothetical protein
LDKEKKVLGDGNFSRRKRERKRSGNEKIR